MGATAEVLIIDDEQVIRDGCERALSSEGYAVTQADGGKPGIRLLGERDFDVVLLDLMMPGIDGFEVLGWIQKNRPQLPVVVITGFATVAKAVSAMKQGAFDFVGKPFTPDYIRIVVRRAIEKQRLAAEAEALKKARARDLLAIAEEQSRLKTVFQCMMESVLITNRDGVVVHHNPAAVNVLQLQSDPVIGKPLSASVDDPKLLNMVREAVDEAKGVTREFAPGSISRLWLQAHCSPILDADGEPLGSVTVFEDITTRKQIDQQKSEFVAMVVHELRAPLASVEQMIYAMGASCDRIVGSPCENLHERMTARTRELLQLIANLLNLSRLESESLVVAREPMCGDEILKNVVEVLKPQAEKKNIELAFESAPSAWWFNGDYAYIRSAFMNVVGNAVKYTPENGQVEVRSQMAGGLVNVCISDSGIGIGADDLAHIFDRFYRVSTAATRRITGSGLGLSVVKKVVEAHNGFIDVRSEPGLGTTFTLSFPMVDPPQNGNTPTAAGA